MPISSLHHAKPSGASLFAVLALSALESLDQEKIDALKSINIHSVGDLLHFKPIVYSQLLMAISRREIGHEIDLEHYLDNTYLNKLPSELPDLKIIAIEGIGGTTEQVFKDIFGIETVREMAVFPPFLEAQSYLTPDSEVFNEPASAPEELMPKILGGTSSIARYSSFVLDEDIRLNTGLYIPKDDLSSLPNIELADLFKTTRLECSVGYIAAFKQSWVNMGTHLGEIIHSLALAPGESRNVLFVEWRRRLRSSRSEETTVDEQLTNSMMHNRALDEVTRITAQEHQSGMTTSANHTVSTAKSESKGFNFGKAMSAVADLTAVVGFPLKVGSQTAANFNSGKSSVYSNNSQVGTIQSSSSGSRDIVGEMTQNITESTLQNSSNIRSLWSTVVVTDEQSEREDIQTRNVTNYNHSHALTVQYFEVVQKYCVKLKLNDWTPILYLPFKAIEFNFNIITKYWHLLKIPLQVYFPEKFEKYNPIVSEPLTIGTNGIVGTDYTVKKIKSIISFNVDEWYKYMGTIGVSTTLIEKQNYPNSIFLWIKDNNGSPVVPPQILFQPVAEQNIQVGLDTLSTLVLTPLMSDFQKPPINPLSSIKINITINYYLEDANGNEQVITKLYSQDINYGELHQSCVTNSPIVISQNISSEIISKSTDTPQSNESLIQEIEDHFNQVRYGYTRYLISSIEKEQLIDIIENLWVGVEGQGTSKRLTDYVYPAPLAISDNYLIFKFKKKPNGISSDSFWSYITKINAVLGEKQLAKVGCEDVFLPTSGVFAEAILGRSNASEFVNPRRFWNWQDSPIPNMAPQILPVQAGNHEVTDQSGVLAPSTPTSNLNIINPPQYALPTSLNAAFQAIQNGNMFRDMSKSGELVSILGALADLANNTAKISGDLTGKAAENALNGAIELGKQVAGIMGNSTGVVGQGIKSNTASPPQTPTEKAAALNNLDDIERKTKSGEQVSPIDKAKADAFGTPISTGENEPESGDGSGSESEGENTSSSESESEGELMTSAEYNNLPDPKSNYFPPNSGDVTSPMFFSDMFNNDPV